MLSLFRRLPSDSRGPQPGDPLMVRNLAYPHRSAMAISAVESAVTVAAAIAAVIVWTRTALFAFVGFVFAAGAVSLALTIWLDRRHDEPFTASPEEVDRFVRAQRVFEYTALGVVCLLMVLLH